MSHWMIGWPSGEPARQLPASNDTPSYPNMALVVPGQTSRTWSIEPVGAVTAAAHRGVAVTEAGEVETGVSATEGDGVMTRSVSCSDEEQPEASVATAITVNPNHFMSPPTAASRASRG